MNYYFPFFIFLSEIRKLWNSWFLYLIPVTLTRCGIVDMFVLLLIYRNYIKAST